MRLAFDILTEKIELYEADFGPDALCYLINAYTKNPEESFLRAVRVTKMLLKLGLPVFSPVIYGHTIVQLVGSGYPDGFWIPVNNAVMKQANIVCILKDEMLPESEGSRKEWEFFSKIAPPKKLLVYDWEKGSLTIQDWGLLSWEDILSF